MRFLRVICCFYISLTLVLCLRMGGGMAETQPDTKAQVVLDGRSLFSLTASDQRSGQERAATVNQQLEKAINQPNPAQVTVQTQDQSSKLLINGQPLLTVTSLDVGPNSTPTQQANLWAQQIRQAVQRGQSDRSIGSLQKMGILAAVIFAIAAGFHVLFGLASNRLHALTSQWLASVGDETDSAPSPLIALFFKMTLVVLRLVLWSSAALYVANLFPWSRHWSYQITAFLQTGFMSPIVSLGEKPYSIITLLILGGVLLSWFVIAGILTNLFKTRVLRLAGIARGAQEAISTLVRYALIVLGMILLLQAWGLNLSSVTILASALGLGVGLGLQNIAKDFSSGLVIIFERPIQVGDFVEIGKFRGTVERIGPRSTDIRTLDFVSIIVPNSRFLEADIINWSHSTPMSRIHLPVGVSYQAEPREVEETLLEVAAQNSDVLEKPAPRVALIGFGASSLDFELLVWVEDPSKQFFLKSDLYFQIFKALSDKNIEIPFPQHDLNLRSVTFTPEILPQIVKPPKAAM
jgi:potassium-dependent mechanosensitive channel